MSASIPSIEMTGSRKRSVEPLSPASICAREAVFSPEEVSAVTVAFSVVLLSAAAPVVKAVPVVEAVPAVEAVPVEFDRRKPSAVRSMLMPRPLRQKAVASISFEVSLQMI